MTDEELLAQHHAGSADAFATLARRHVDWVHGVARRRVGGDASLSDDVTQATFLVLAQRSRSLRAGTVLPAWLFGVACKVAARAVRDRRRRERHERQRAAMTEQPADNADRTALAPVVDALVERLSQIDREAIVLRFYRQLSHAEVGHALGIGEEAARKRVERAVERLRDAARRRGVAVATLAVVLSIGPTPASAPAGIVAVVATNGSNPLIAGGNAARLARNAMRRSTTPMLAAAVCVAVASWIAVGKPAHPMPANQGTAATVPTTNALYGGSAEIQSQGSRMKVIGQLVWHSIKNEKQPRYPHTLGELLGVAKRISTPGTPPATLAAYFILPQDAIAIPAEPSAGWIDGHTHLVYLAADADRSVFDQANQVDTIVFHTRLETPYHEPGVGGVILAGFADGRVNTIPIAEAPARIAASVKTLDAARAAK